MYWASNVNAPSDEDRTGNITTGNFRQSFDITYHYGMEEHNIILADSTTASSSTQINFAYITQMGRVYVFHGNNMNAVSGQLPFVDAIDMGVVTNNVLVLRSDNTVWRSALSGSTLGEFVELETIHPITQLVTGNSHAHVSDDIGRVWNLTPATGAMNLLFNTLPVRKLLTTTTGSVGITDCNQVRLTSGSITGSNVNSPFTGDIIDAWTITNQGIVIQTTTGIYGTGSNNNGWFGWGTTGNTPWRRIPIPAGETLLSVAPLGLNTGVTHGAIYVTNSGRVFVAGTQIGALWGSPGAGSSHLVEIDTFDDFNIVQMLWSRRHIIMKNPYGQVILFEMTSGTASTITRTPLSGSQFSTISILEWNNIPEYIPIRLGFNFDGWYLDSAYTIPLTLTTMPSHNLLVHARWISL